MKKLAFLVVALSAIPALCPYALAQVRPITLQDLVASPVGRRDAVLAPDGKHFAVIDTVNVVIVDPTDFDDRAKRNGIEAPLRPKKQRLYTR